MTSICISHKIDTADGLVFIDGPDEERCGEHSFGGENARSEALQFIDDIWKSIRFPNNNPSVKRDFVARILNPVKRFLSDERDYRTMFCCDVGDYNQFDQSFVQVAVKRDDQPAKGDMEAYRHTLLNMLREIVHFNASDHGMPAIRFGIPLRPCNQSAWVLGGIDALTANPHLISQLDEMECVFSFTMFKRLSRDDLYTKPIIIENPYEAMGNGWVFVDVAATLRWDGKTKEVPLLSHHKLAGVPQNLCREGIPFYLFPILSMEDWE